MGRKGDGSLIKSISYPKSLGTEIDEVTKKTFIENMEDLAEKEGISLSELTVRLWKEHYKKHGNGNPNFQISQWIKDPTLTAQPALGNDVMFWKDYIENLKDNEELKELMAKSQSILELTNKKFRHDTTNVRYF